MDATDYLRTTLGNKFKERYTDISDFRRRTGCPLGIETCRLAIYEGKIVSAPSLALIAYHLGFAPKEIKGLLRKVGDRHYYQLIGDTETVGLSPERRALLDALDAVTASYPEGVNLIADQLALMARAYGVDISEQLRRIRRDKRTRQGLHRPKTGERRR